MERVKRRTYYRVGGHEDFTLWEGVIAWAVASLGMTFFILFAYFGVIK